MGEREMAIGQVDLVTNNLRGDERRIAESVGARIKRLRMERGWSQEDLAQRTGIRAQTVSLLEVGQTKLPQPDTLRRYAEALGVTLDYLLYGADGEPPLNRRDLFRRLLRDERNIAYLERTLELLMDLERKGHAPEGE